jgi:hypothetical protein
VCLAISLLHLALNEENTLSTWFNGLLYTGKKHILSKNIHDLNRDIELKS